MYLFQPVVLMIKADNRIVIDNLRDKVRLSQLKLLELYDEQLLRDINKLPIGKLPIGKLVDFYDDNPNGSTFTVCCPFYLMSTRKKLIANVKDVIVGMRTIGFKLKKASLTSETNDNGGEVNQITLSFHDSIRGYASDYPTVYTVAYATLKRLYSMVYNEFTRVEDEFTILNRRRKKKKKKKKKKKYSTAEEKNALKILGITKKNPSRRDVLNAYRRKAIDNHPDKPGGDNDKMQAINGARMTLLPNKLKLKF